MAERMEGIEMEGMGQVHAGDGCEQASEERKPWEQQAEEPDKYYAIFQEYLKLPGRRSYRAAAEARRAVDPSSPGDERCMVVAKKWGWKARAAAWDKANPLPKVTGREPWEQEPGESDRWYGYFKRFLALGPTRAIHQTLAMAAEEDPAAPHKDTFYDQARRRHWRERAEAWDLRGVEQEIGEASEQAVGEGPVGEDAVGDGQQPWELQPGEPLRMYGYFCHYLELGPTRNLRQAFRDFGHGQSAQVSPSGETYVLARRWQWEQRAAAWDAHQRDRLAERTLDLRTAFEDRRLAIAEAHFDRAVAAFDAAELDDVTRAEARRMLPTIHRILMDTAALQRLEWENIAKRGKAAAGEKVESADEMHRVAQRYRQMMKEEEEREKQRKEQREELKQD